MMGPFVRKAIIGTLCAVFGGGCAAHHVKVNAYLSHDLTFPNVENDKPVRIAIVVGTEPKEPLLEDEVARKIKFLLDQGGYQVAPKEKSEYLLTCWLSIDQSATHNSVQPVYTGPYYATSFVYTHHHYWTAVTTEYPGDYYYIPYSYTDFRRSANLALYERHRWEKSDEQQLGEAAVWTCTAVSIGSSSDLRRVANYLLLAAFDYFGADTGGELRIPFAPDDPRVHEIIEAGR